MTRDIMLQYGKDKFAPLLPPADERITLDQALRAQTIDSAYVLGMEDQIGSLKVGKLADLVILDDMQQCRVGQVVVAGRLVDDAALSVA